MKKILYTGTILLFVFLQAPAQQTFNKIIGGKYRQNVNDLAGTVDGGYVMLGVTNTTADANTDIFVNKLNINGDLVWGKIIGTAGYDFGDAVTVTKDGGIAVAGSGSNGMSLTKLSSLGSILWSKTYSAAEFNGAHAVLQTLDGGLALGGYASTDTAGTSGYFVKTDALGNVQWSKLIFKFSFSPSIQSMVQTADSGYVCVFNAKDKNDFCDVFVIKIDKLGNFVWSRSIGGESDDFPESIINTSDGGLAILASTFSFDTLLNANMYVIKLDNNANLKWSRVIGDAAGNEYGKSLIQLPDGGLVAAGQTSILGEGNEDVYIVKLDKDGNLVYTKTVGTQKEDLAKAIIGRADGSFTIGAYTDFYNAGNNYEMMLLKFDSEANICNNTGSGGFITDPGAKLYTQTVKVSSASTTTTNRILTISSVGFVTTICSQTLPVKLIDFTASKNNNTNILLWTAAGEINISNYTVERSNDGIHFADIGSINALGNNAPVNEYSFTDINPAKAINYYRLKIINTDGRSEYSIIRYVNNSAKLSVRLYTNPVQQHIPLEFSTDKNETVQISILGMDGKLYSQVQMAVISGINLQNVSSDKLPAGIYFIKIKSAYDDIILRFVKQ